jgi:protein-tyrosine kinase
MNPMSNDLIPPLIARRESKPDARFPEETLRLSASAERMAGGAGPASPAGVNHRRTDPDVTGEPRATSASEAMAEPGGEARENARAPAARIVVSSQLVAAAEPLHPRTEQLRALRTQLLIRWSNLGAAPRALALISPNSSEGRSYLAANLAVLFAQLGRRTLLIDADLRAPRQFEFFGIPNRPGLLAVLAGRAGREAAISLPAFGPLSVVPAGPYAPHPQELLLRPTLGAFLKQMESEFDAILIDTPPARQNADAQGLAFLAGSALVIARAGHTRVDDTASVVRQLTDAGVLLLGTVLNNF